MSYGVAWANLSNTPFRKYKKNGHEGGVATPFIMHWPDGLKEKNSIKSDVASIIDIMPTLLDVTKTTYPSNYKGNIIQPMEGLSLMPVLNNQSLDRDEWFVEHGGNRAYRKADWKLVQIKGSKKWELYNLKNDPTETTNLASKHPEKIISMEKRWVEWAKRVKVLGK
jgi:arylsulfatase A-like enzyme